MTTACADCAAASSGVVSTSSAWLWLVVIGAVLFVVASEQAEHRRALENLGVLKDGRAVGPVLVPVRVASYVKRKPAEADA